MTSSPSKTIGIDTGGTFTDFVLVDGAEIRVHKEPSTPENPARAVVQGLRPLLGNQPLRIVHGSTVATNALLERRGATVALITTSGFEDVLEIGRQTRSAIYDLAVTKAPTLIPAERRFGVRERLDQRGNVLESLDPREVRGLVDTLRALDVDAVAICLLHAYANSTHEHMIRDELESALDCFVTASSRVLPEFREYERCSTTVVNAYVGPVISSYLASLAEELQHEAIHIMQSNGGVIALRAAREFAVQTILSGPAGGAVGGFEMGRRAGYEDVITFDMGGTSTDVCLCPGRISRTTEAVIGEAPIRVPVIDIHTVGAGGGSIAYLDPGGALRVGPRSAGAMPGPICYDRGGSELTVTDANLFLGRLSSDHFLGGQQALPTDPVDHAMTRFAKKLGLTPIEAAQGIVRIANATMERAIRVISLERGFDPRDFTLVCFGGAGAMHAADLARDLAIPRVLIPRAAGILSALGMLLADIIRDYSQTVLQPSTGLDPTALTQTFDELEARARTDFESEGLATNQLSLERELDMRYVGQGYELSVPMSNQFEREFHHQHDQRYGYADPDRPTEVVNVRLRVVGVTSKPQLPSGRSGGPDASGARLGDHTMVFDGETVLAALFDRERLRPGNVFDGPALVVEYSTTTVVPPDYQCRIDGPGNLILEHQT